MIIPGRYRHYKGGEYEVLFTAKHSETLEPMVVYRSAADPSDLWVRPASMWNETVQADEGVKTRFVYLGEATK